MNTEKKLNKTDIVFLIILVLLPFLHVTTGIDITDSGYSLGNFENMESMNTTWIVATFIANIMGKLFTVLPFGSLWLGMNVYSTLIISITVMVSYLYCAKRFPSWIVFIGELIAVSLCWCPHMIMYNYLTYLFMTVAVVLLWKGLETESISKLSFAGIFLASNVFVRFPNVVQSLLIVVVIYDCILRKRGLKKSLKYVLACFIGYLVGTAFWISVISVIYGIGAYPDMIQSLFSMTEDATAYTPTQMIKTVIFNYLGEFITLSIPLLIIAIGIVLNTLVKKKVMRVAVGIVSVLAYGGFLIYGLKKWAFSLNYNEYKSMFFWAATLLFFTMGLSCYLIICKRAEREDKMMAATMLVILAVTPLGSNNGIYPNFNNLFLVAPFTLYILWKSLFKGHRLLEEDSGKIQWFSLRIGSLVLFACIIIQTVLFGVFFTFRDNGFMIDTKEKVVGNEVLAGMHTNPENAKQLEEITSFIDCNGYHGEKAVFYGNIPALSYILGLPGAISHTWPDLLSYPVSDMQEEINSLSNPPLMIVDATKYENLLEETVDGEEKTELLHNYLVENSYSEVFRNSKYVIYEAMPSK